MISRTTVRAVGLVLVLISAPAHPAINSDINAATVTAFWNGGNLTLQQNFCINSRRVGGGPPQPTPYDVTATGGNPFSLVLDGNTIPVTLSWVDLITNNSEQLQPGITSAQNKTGSDAVCPNARLTIFIAEADIAGNPSGIFTRDFVLTLGQPPGSGGNQQDEVVVTVQVEIPDTIRISELDDFDLGLYAGTDINVSQTLCVFRGSGGNYAVTAAGSGAGTSFTLTDGTGDIPYTATWNDGSGPAALDPGVLLGNRTNSFSNNDTCNGGTNNNVTLSVSINAVDVDAVNSAGNYSGTLTLLVEME